MANVTRFPKEKSNDGRQPVRLSCPVHELPLVACKGCGCTEFNSAQQVRRASALVNSSGRDQYISIDVSVCLKCGQVLPERP
ncbi:MAG TPA: hypothetical protein DCZ95_12640 [Verrucomicrobia bacterium]|nr:hypothetical protein [Verrucomicrobiota bacterium]